MLSVRSGALYRNQIGYEYRKIKKIIKPFRGYWKYGKPDFLIMELKSPFTLIEGFVQPACLSSKVPFIYYIKIKNILKGSLDSISSPSSSVKIQTMGWKDCFRCKGQRQNIAGHCRQKFCILMFVDNTQQCLASTPFPPII